MSKQKAPATLSREAAAWWRKITEEYEIADEAGKLILQTALESFDVMRRAQEILKRDGMVVTDRFNQPKAHPMTTTERDARASLLAGIKQLNLDLEPLKDGPGRPAGR